MDYKLEELIDVNLLQSLQDKLNKIYSFPSAILDNNGKILTAVAWQDICTRFHRQNPESEKECIKSDKYINQHLHNADPAVSYKCPHGLIDNATPIVIDGKHLGNFFTGQFFLDERPDEEFFKRQAEKYGFNEEEYLEAVCKVPVWSKEKLEHYLDFIKGFIEIIAEIGLKNLRELESNRILKESEERYKSILECTSDWVWEIDENSRYSFCSENVENILGFKPEEIIGKTPFDLMIPEEAENNRKIFLELTAAKSSIVDFENWNLHKDGRKVCLLTNGIPKFDNNGNVVGYKGADKDVTDKKESELLLQKKNLELIAAKEKAEENERRLDEAQHLSQIGSWEWIAKDDLVIWSKELYNLYGLDPNLPAPSYAEQPKFYTKESYQRLNKAVEICLATGVPYMLELDVFKNNEPFKILAVGTPKKDVAGNIIGLQGTVQNITIQKEMELSLIKAKEEAEESRERFNLAVQASNDGLFDWNLVTNEIYYSPRWKNILGYEDNELPNDFSVWENNTEPEDVKKSWELQKKLITKQIDRFVMEFKMRHKEGHWVEILSRAEAIFDENGNAVRIVGTHTDISERKKHEQLLDEEKKRLAYILEGTNAGTWEWNIITGETVFNERWAEIFGYTLDELSPISVETWLNNTHPEDIKTAKELLDRHFKGELDYYECEIRMRHKNGNWVWVIDRGKVYEWDENGNPVKMAGTHQDITDRKLAQENLIQSEEKLAEAMQIAKLGHWELDLATNVFTFNDQFYSLIQTNVNEMGGYKMAASDYASQFLYPEEMHLVKSETDKAVNSTDPNYFNSLVHRVKFKDGNTGYIYVSIKVKRDSLGNPVMTYGVNQDITERKKAEEDLRKSEERYSLLLKNLEAGIIVHAPDTTIKTINKMASEILGLTEEQLKGKSAFDRDWSFINEKGETLPYEDYPVNRILSNKKPIKDYIVGMHLGNKKDIAWATVNGFPIFSNNGEISEIVISFFDITNRKQIEFELAESVERFKALHNSSFGGIAIHDKGIILECNQGLSDMTGYSLEELIGMNGLLLIAREHRDMVMSKIVSGYEKPYEANGLRKNGQEFPMRLEARNVPYKGRNARTVEFRDITESKRSEEALRKSESIKNTMLSNIGDVIVIIDKDGINRYKSPNITKLFGWEPEELIGKKTWDTVHPDDLENGQKFFGSILREPNATGSTELRYMKKDGTYLWIEISVINLLHDNDIHGILGNYHDITERKHAEASLAKSRYELKAIYDLSPVMMCLVDEHREVIFANQAFTALTNTEEELLQGGRACGVFGCINAKDDVRGCGFGANCQNCTLRIAMDDTLKNGKGHTNVEYHTTLMQNGKTREVYLLGSTALIEGNNNRNLLLCLHDITELKKAEKALLVSEIKYRQLFETLSEGVALNEIIYNDQGEMVDYRIVEVNPAFYTTAQYDGQAVGRFATDLYQLPVELITTFWREHKKNDTVQFTEMISPVNGRYSLVATSPFRNDRFVTSFIDITERKLAEVELEKHRNHLEELVRVRTEELEKANEELQKIVDKEKELSELKSRFISITSHEFRTPLTSVRSSAELLQKLGHKWTDEKKNEHFNRIVNAVEYLTNLLDDILTLNRSESGKISFSPHMIDLNNFTEECLNDVKSAFTNKHKLRYIYKTRQKEFLLDPKLMKFILNNLLTNAAKYSPSGGTVELKISKIKKALKIEISDEGIGISKEDLSKIFDSFYRTKQSENIAGTGLGLSIVKKAVELHKGEIYVESELGKGTKFIVHIPLQ